MQKCRQKFTSHQTVKEERLALADYVKGNQEQAQVKIWNLLNEQERKHEYQNNALKCTEYWQEKALYNQF